MTVSTTYTPMQYTGNGSTTSFAFPYIFWVSGDIKVTTTDTTTGIDTVLSSGYSVTGGSGSTGSVVFSVAPSSTTRVTLEYNLDYTQTVNLVDGDPLYAEELEGVLDRAYVNIQRVSSEKQYTLKFPVTDTPSSLGEIPNATTRANSILSFDASGVPSAVALASLGGAIDTTFTGLATNDLLAWNGSVWANIHGVSASHIANLAVTSAKISSGAATSGQVLSADGSGNTSWSSVSSDWVRLHTYTPSGAATVDITSVISSTYDNYVIVYNNVVPSIDGQGLRLQVSIDNGSSWRSTAGDYKYVRRSYYTGGTAGGSGSSETNGYIGLGPAQVGNATGEGCSGRIDCMNLNSTTLRKDFFDHGAFTYTTGESAYAMGAAQFTVYASAVNALRLLFDTGNISGQIVIYGVKKS